jgi:hypothetical protein
MIANGTYALSGSGVLLYIQRGGTAPVGRHFVGASRHGVVIRGRGTVDDGVSNVSIRNLTFTLAGYSQSGSFATLTVYAATNVTVSQVTFTGDCNTGLRGGHIETDSVNGLLVDASLIENYGHCSGGGHEDHGSDGHRSERRGQASEAGDAAAGVGRGRDVHRDGGDRDRQAEPATEPRSSGSWSAVGALPGTR